MTSIAELRRLEAEATPGEWEATEAEPNDGTSLVIGGKVSDLRLIADCQIRQDAALIVAMRNALPELLKALEWQPIDTAPKDGSSFLAWGPLCRTVVVENDPEDPMPTDIVPSGHHLQVRDGKNYFYLRGEYPTHWRPLPLPPHGGVDVG